MLFGKPVPRIRPMLRRVVADFPDRAVLLVNSDIYPAIRNAGVFDLYFRRALLRRRLCRGPSESRRHARPQGLPDHQRHHSPGP